MKPSSAILLAFLLVVSSDEALAFANTDRIEGVEWVMKLAAERGRLDRSGFPQYVN